MPSIRRDNEDRWGLLLRQVLAHDGRQLRQMHPEGEPTPACPPLTLFLPCHRGGDWEQRYKDHFAAGCGYCQQLLDVAARLEEQLRAGTLAPDAEPLPEEEPWQVRRPSARPSAPAGCVVFLLVRSRHAAVWGRRGGQDVVPAPPASEQRWHLEPTDPNRIDSEDGPAFRLSQEVAQRSYNLPEGTGVDLRIDLLLEPGARPDTVVPVVEVSPGPHRDREPLRLLLTFAEDCIREFVVRPHTLLNKACLRSDPAEPIPAAVVAGWTNAGGPPSLAAAFSVG
jgi:hypothetical protein